MGLRLQPAVNRGLCVWDQGRAETEPSPDWRRSHSGVFLQLSWRDRSPLRSPGRVEQSRGVRLELQPRPRTGGLSPLTPLDWPMIGAAARVDSAREAVRKDARHPGGCRTSVTAGLTPYSNPTRRPTSTRLASKDAGLVSRDTVCPHILTEREIVSGPIIPGEPFR